MISTDTARNTRSNITRPQPSTINMFNSAFFATNIFGTVVLVGRADCVVVADVVVAVIVVVVVVFVVVGGGNGGVVTVVVVAAVVFVRSCGGGAVVVPVVVVVSWLDRVLLSLIVSASPLACVEFHRFSAYFPVVCLLHFSCKFQ